MQPHTRPESRKTKGYAVKTHYQGIALRHGMKNCDNLMGNVLVAVVDTSFEHA